MSTTAEPDTREMVVIHRVFRREFRLLPDLISRVGPGDTGRAAIVGEHLSDIVAALHHHHKTEDDLAEEEQEILPLVRKYLTVEQWSKLGKRGAESIDDKHKRLLFLGAILEETSPEEERNFLSHLPTPVRLIWRFAGRRQYGNYIRRARGTA